MDIEINRDSQRKNAMVDELTQGKKSANELKRKLQPDITSTEICVFLLEKVLTHYDNALSILQSTPPSLSPKSRIKKRKISERKKEDEVRVCSLNGNDSQSQLTDGYNWRKYGQKDILGAVHPRAYYRCTHRQTQGCLATKKVQQTDKDPSIFQVIYKGKHSCIDEASKQNKDKPFLPLLLQTDENKNVDSFSFQSSPYENSQAATTTIFEGPNQQLNGIATYSTPFLLPPETPESYFSMSNGAGCSNSFGQDYSGFDEMLSDTTSFANFQLGDFDLSEDDFRCQYFFDSADCFDPYLI